MKEIDTEIEVMNHKIELNQEIEGATEKEEEKEKMATEVKEKIEEATMVAQGAKDIIMVEEQEAMGTAGKGMDPEVAARRLLAKGNLL